MTGLLYCFPLTSNWVQPVSEKEPTDLSTQNQSDQSSRKQPDLSSCLKMLNMETGPLLLVGEEKCGKTLMLFQAAVSYASQDCHVTYISRRPLTRMPLPFHGMMRPETAGLLETLTFLYMNTAKEVIQYCSALHTKSVLPDVIIIDDLEYYLAQLTEPSPEVGCAQLCAVLTDTISFIKTKREEERTVRTLIRQVNDQGPCWSQKISVHIHQYPIDIRSLGVLMMGSRSKPYLQPVLKQFRVKFAVITNTNTSNETVYQLSSELTRCSLQLTYTVQATGLYLRDVDIQALKPP